MSSETSNIKSKEEILEKFLEQYKDLPKQGSAEWLKLRQSSFGGSEISSLIGSSSYGSTKSLLANKCGLTSYVSNFYTRWGKLFEIITVKLCELVFETNVYETSSLPSKIEGLSYSPDGLAVIQLSSYIPKMSKLYINYTATDRKVEECSDDDCVEIDYEYIVLFEYKSPFISIPGGKIPTNYTAQVLTGLFVIDIADFCIFINNTYRICHLSDWEFDNKNYNRELHCSDLNFEKRTKYEINVLEELNFSNSPYVIGKFWIKDLIGKNTGKYKSLENILARYNERIQDEKTDEIISLSFMNQYELNDLFGLIDSKEIEINYELYINPNSLDDIEFIKLHKPYIKYASKKDLSYSNVNDKIKYVAQIPWKLMIFDVIKQTRNSEYFKFEESLIPTIKKNLEILNKINEHKTEAEKANYILKNYYTNTTISDNFIDKELVKIALSDEPPISFNSIFDKKTTDSNNNDDISDDEVDRIFNAMINK